MTNGRWRFRGLPLGAAIFLAGGCATLPPVPAPLTAKANSRVEIRSVYAHAAKDGVTVGGFARRRGFGFLPGGSHLHVTAFRKDGTKPVEGDAFWHPPVHHRTLISSYQARLHAITSEEIARIEVEFREIRD